MLSILLMMGKYSVVLSSKNLQVVFVQPFKLKVRKYKFLNFCAHCCTLDMIQDLSRGGSGDTYFIVVTWAQVVKSLREPKDCGNIF